MLSEDKLFLGIHEEKSLQSELFLEERTNPLPFILFQEGPAYLLNLMDMTIAILFLPFTQVSLGLLLFNLILALEEMDIPVTLLFFFRHPFPFSLRVKLVIYILMCIILCTIIIQLLFHTRNFSS